MRPDPYVSRIRPKILRRVLASSSSLLHKLSRVTCNDKFFIRWDDPGTHAGIGCRDTPFATTGVGIGIKFKSEKGEALADILSYRHGIFPDTAREYNGIDAIHCGGVGANILPQAI